MHNRKISQSRPLPATMRALTRSSSAAFSPQSAALAVLLVACLPGLTQAQAVTAGYEADYAASGFVAPAGMPSPDQYYSAVEQASFFGPGGPISSRMHGCDGGCGQMGCDGSCQMGGDGASGCGGCGDGACGYGGCGDGSCGCGGSGACGNGACGCGGGVGGILGHGLCGNGSCGPVAGALAGCLRSLMPYGEAGRCSQRWYDVSADLMLLGRTSRSGNDVLTTRNQAGTAVLFGDSADDEDLEAGARISAAFIFGAGGNVEFTYLGGQEWGDTASVNTNSITTVTFPGADPLDPSDDIIQTNGDLFSFLSNFGTRPTGGEDDTDRSIRHSIRTFSTFHSAEMNYRRRTVEQNCRYQGSWLVGLRYLRYDDDFDLLIRGADDNTENGNLPRFFNSFNGVDNKMFGVQGGGDLWWNVIAGVNLGIGAKVGVLNNNVDRNLVVESNSLGAFATPGSLVVEDGDNKSTVMGEFEATALYRISHSWTLRTQYYVLAVDDVAFGYDITHARNVADQAFNNGLPRADRVPVTALNSIDLDSLTIQGISFGAEYIW